MQTTCCGVWFREIGVHLYGYNLEVLLYHTWSGLAYRIIGITVKLVNICSLNTVILELQLINMSADADCSICHFVILRF